MLNGFIVLIAYLLIGDILSDSFNFPVPGGVIGMILLLVTLIIRGKVDKPLNDSSQGLIAYIGLLFVPAGAGLSLYLDLLAQEWPVILFAGITSMLLTLGISAYLFTILSKRGR